MSAFVTAGAGFLLAVLWFDLMFDVQVIGRDGPQLPESVLSSIASYYARVTTAARPMNRLIAATMAATLAAVIVELADGPEPAWPRRSSSRAGGPCPEPFASAVAPATSVSRAAWPARSCASICSASARSRP
jgi:hypothetical protein